MGCGKIAAGRRSYNPLWEARPGPMGRGEAPLLFEPEPGFPCPFPYRHRKTRFPDASASRRTSLCGVAAGRRCLFEPEPGFPCPFPCRHRKTRFPDASASRRTSLCGVAAGRRSYNSRRRPAPGPMGRGEAPCSCMFIFLAMSSSSQRGQNSCSPSR